MDTAQSGATTAIILIFIIAVIVGVFLLCRQILLWYWRVNESIELQQKNNDLLRKIITLLEEQSTK